VFRSSLNYHVCGPTFLTCPFSDLAVWHGELPPFLTLHLPRIFAVTPPIFCSCCLSPLKWLRCLFSFPSFLCFCPLKKILEVSALLLLLSTDNRSCLPSLIRGSRKGFSFTPFFFFLLLHLAPPPTGPLMLCVRPYPSPIPPF